MTLLNKLIQGHISSIVLVLLFSTPVALATAKEVSRIGGRGIGSITIGRRRTRITRIISSCNVSASGRLSTSSACGVSTLGSPRHVIAVKSFFFRLVLIHLIRRWVCGRTRWGWLTDGLLRLGSQVITLKIPTVGYLMSGGLTIGTMALLGDGGFFFRGHYNGLVHPFNTGCPMRKMKLTTVSSNHAIFFVTILRSELYWLV